MPERKPIKAFRPNAPAVSYIEEDEEDAPNKKQFFARALLLICLMLVAIGAAYDIGTKLVASPKVRKHGGGGNGPAKASSVFVGETSSHPRASEWLKQKFPAGEGLDTGSRLCYCAPKESDCGPDANRLILWGRGYQWGFFSLFYGVLCAMDEFGSKTFVDFTSSPEGENLYQVERGDNTWEYAFEQPGNRSLVDIELDSCKATSRWGGGRRVAAAEQGKTCVLRPYEEVAHGDMGCSDDPSTGQRCCTLHGDAERAVARDKVAFEKLSYLKRCRTELGYPNREMTPAQVQRSRDVAQRNLKLKPAMKAQYEAFFNSHMRGKDILIGVHKRETDKITECVAPDANEYYKIIDQILVDNDGKNVAIYLATDSAAAIQAYKQRYGTKVVYRVDAIRSSGLEPVHLAKGNRASGKKQIRDVVMDALLLGRCQYLIRTGSGVSMAAQVFSDPGQVVHYLHAGHC